MQIRKGAGVLPFAAILLCACHKGTDLPIDKTITSGSKWGISIGSSPPTVYAQLQALGKEKDFNVVDISYRPGYSKLQDIQQQLLFYNAVTWENNTAVIDRAIIEYSPEIVTSISIGGGLTSDVLKWPGALPDSVAILVNDPIDRLYFKLSTICRLPAYSSFQVTLPPKPLDRPFDPDMINYAEWTFYMSVDVSSGESGTYFVRLHFSNGQLHDIQYTYNEDAVYE